MRFTPVAGTQLREGVAPVLRALPVLAFAVVVAGCSGTDQATVASSGSAATAAPAGSSAQAAPGTSAASDQTSGSASSTESAPSPTSSGLPGYHEYGLSDSQFPDFIQRTQTAIADCMRQAGFEYVPVDVGTVEAAQKRVRTDPGYTRKTFKQKWGLAVTTRFDDPVRDTGLGPNLAIWKGLPASDQKAYARTLFGDTTHHQDFVWLFDEERLYEAGGCTKTGVNKVFPAPMLKDNFTNPKDVLVNSDKRILDARAGWSKCMKAAGYEYKQDQDEIIDEYTQRLDDITQGQDPTTLTGAKLAALKKLQQEEIAVALADLDCQIKHTDAVYRTVEIEIYGRPVSG